MWGKKFNFAQIMIGEKPHITTLARTVAMTAMILSEPLSLDIIAQTSKNAADADSSTSWQIAGIIFFSLIGIAAIILLFILIKSFVTHRKMRRRLKNTAMESILTQEMTNFTIAQSNAFLWEYAYGQFVFNELSRSALHLEDAHYKLQEERFPNKEDFQRIASFMGNAVPGTYTTQMYYIFHQHPHWYEIRMRVTQVGDETARKGVMVRIDEKKAREAKVEEVHRLLANANKKESCLTLLNNEIHTPATIIKGFAEVLMTIGDELDEEDRRSHYSDMTFCGYVLAKIIDDMLQLDQIDKGEYEPEMEVLPMSELITDIFTPHSYLMMKRKDIEMVIDNSDQNLKIKVDQIEFNKIIANILGNAAKFSPRGTTVHIGWRQERANVVIYIQDEGIGIDEEQQGNIFQRFYKINPSIPGVGNGLALTKCITEAMGGKIGVNSQRGVGSRFWISFPACQTTESATATTNP